MLNKAPGGFKLAAIAGVLLAGPVTVFSFILGGAYAGAIALIVLGFFFVIMYMIAVRLYT